SFAAISTLVRPSAIYPMISISLGVRCLLLGVGLIVRSLRWLNKFWDIKGLIYFSSFITLDIAIRSSLLPVSLFTKASAPALSILLTIEASHNILTTITLIAGFSFLINLVASNPFRRGIFISMMTQSILSLVALLT